jgi:hypothetical protein
MVALTGSLRFPAAHSAAAIVEARARWELEELQPP